MQWTVPRELLWAIIGSLIIIVIGLWPSHYPYSQTTKVQPQHQAENRIGGGNPPEHAPAPQIDPSREQQSEGAGEHAPEFAPLGVKPGEWLLSLVTLLLWGATVRLVRGGEDTAKRQLRAYVWIGVRGSPNLDAPNFGVVALTHNSGQTPAYEVHTWANVKPIAEPLPAGFVFPEAPEQVPGARFVVAPTSQHTVHTAPTPLLTEEEKLAIKDGYLVLYFWGEVRYRDTFGENRKTRFRLRLSIEPGFTGSWAYCDEGNKAD